MTRPKLTAQKKLTAGSALSDKLNALRQTFHTCAIHVLDGKYTDL